MPASTASPVTSSASLPAETRLDAPRLVVRDLTRALRFYEGVLGLRLHERTGDVARLGTGADDLVELREDPTVRPAGRHVGLYHVALNAPSREELARTAQRLAASRTPVQGASDHHTHEAIYLADPDGNGLELAADRPRALWAAYETDERTGDLRPPRPLDVAALLATVAGEEPQPHAAAGAFVGHVHLHVADLDASERFWTDLVGFERRLRFDSATFVSAGGYHHHVALNTWRGAAPRPAGTAGLDHLVVRAPGAAVAAAADRLRDAGVAVTEDDRGTWTTDPAGTGVLLRAHDEPPTRDARGASLQQ